MHGCMFLRFASLLYISISLQNADFYYIYLSPFKIQITEVTTECAGGAGGGGQGPEAHAPQSQLQEPVVPVGNVYRV